MSAKNDPNIILSQYDYWDFPGGPVVKSLYFQCRGHRFHLWSGNQDPTVLTAKKFKKKKSNNKKNPTMIAMLSGAINSI